MGSKVSTISRKKKRVNTSSTTKSKKSYNFHDSHSIFSHFTSSSTPVTVHDEKHDEHPDSIPSITESMFTSGRTFHHVQNSAYWFPNDDEEMDRLTGQHFALKTLFGGNVMAHISDNLDMHNPDTLVLDLGCGPGTWLMDIATEYPSSQFIGVDMCDVFPNNIRPPNVSFQVGNALGRLPFADDTFDFVNIRLFIIALKEHEWPIVVQEVYRILKPGGFIQMVECGMLERGNDFVVYAGTIFKEVIRSRGQEPYISHKLQPLLEGEKFNVIHYESKDVHLGRTDPLSKEFLWDACTIFRTAQAVVQEPLGYTSEEYPQFLDRLYKELQKQPDSIWSFAICVGQK